MKTHAKNAAVSGGLVPVVLAASTAIGNACQQALDLNLQGIALAIYLVGFAIAAAIVMAIALKVEGQKALADLTSPEGLDNIMGLVGKLGLGDLFKPPASTTDTPPDHPFAGTPFPTTSAPTAAIAPPPAPHRGGEN